MRVRMQAGLRTPASREPGNRLPGAGVSLLIALVLCACGGETPGAPDAGLPDARTLDAGPPQDTGPWCPLDPVGTAEASGITPLGEFSAPLSWYGILGGECGGFQVVLVPDRESMDPLVAAGLWQLPRESVSDVVVIGPRNWDHDNGGWLNTGEMVVAHYQGNASAEATGIITVTEAGRPYYPVDPSDPPTFSASFTVDAPGWSLSGRVDAPYCEHLSIYCP